MAIDFPNSPATNDIYTVGGKTWKFDGTAWKSDTMSGVANGYLPLVGGVLSGQVIQRVTDAGGIDLQRFSSTGGPSLWFSRSTSDTVGVTSGVVANSRLGGILFTGWDTTTYGDGADIVSQAEGTWSATSHPASLRFYTAAVGGTTLLERMEISEDGRVFFTPSGGTTAGYTSIETDSTIKVRSTTSGGVNVTRYSSTNAPSINLTRQVTDTIGATGGAVTGNALGQIRFQGWNTTVEAIGASIFVYAEETWSPTSQATSMQFETTVPGAILTAQRIKINSNTTIDFTPGGGYTTGFTYIDTDGSINQKGTASGNLGITRYSSTSQPSINIRRSRSDTINTSTGAVNTTGLGAVNFMGYDAASVYATGASVSATALETWSATARGTKLSFATVPLTASALTTKMEIGPDGLITGVGPSLGPWTAYTPVMSGTGWAIGNGLVEGYYCQVGKTVHFRAVFQMGTTTTYGTGANVIVSLPALGNRFVPTNSQPGVTMWGYYRDDSAAAGFHGPVNYQNQTTVVPRVFSGTGSIGAVLSNTAPFTWAVNDDLVVEGYYDLA